MPQRDEGLIQDLTLMLLYLTSWEEKGSRNFGVRRSWKQYDWDAIDSLCDEGLISTNKRAKSAYLSDEACKRAEILVKGLEVVRSFDFGEVQSKEELRKEHPGGFRLRVKLDLEDLHLCWREIIVPAYFTFADLHEAIQASFLWWGYHLHDFKLRSQGRNLMLVDSQAYGVDAMFAPMPKNCEVVEDASIYLDEVFPRTLNVKYSYDYGDGWEHSIKLIEVIKDMELETPVCTDGEGDAPPEDVGSIYGFEHFLHVMGDENHPEHDEMKAWGHTLFYEPFSVEAVNARIEKWETGELLEEWYQRNGD